MPRTSAVGHGTRTFPFLAGVFETSELVYTTIGACPSLLPNPQTWGTWRFVAELIVTVGRTVSIQLYNVTDAVQVCELTANSVNPTTVTYALVPGVTAGFPLAYKDYRVDIKMDAGANPEAVFCRNARIEHIGI